MPLNNEAKPNLQNVISKSDLVGGIDKYQHWYLGKFINPTILPVTMGK